MMDVKRIGRCIADARKKCSFTQEQLAEKIGISTQAVSKWENGHNLPDIENLMQIAELTNTPYSVLLGEPGVLTAQEHFTFRDRLFHEDNMFTRMKTFASAEKLDETYRALYYMRERHIGQFRRQGLYSSAHVLYINHPLLMACQATAFGIRDDALLAAILLHDVVEDTGVSAEELPFSERVRKIVELVSFSVPEGMTKEEAKERYYQRIAGSGDACVVKIIDRCSNVSTMGGAFTREKMCRYVEETEKYVLPLMRVLKNGYPEYSSIAFLVKYQIVSILETVKYLICPM